ncbi:MAG: glutathione peroxidase [Nocardioidaceae bacterium]|nr:glutathione peroxidase [Nocardioidaceae bacterium]
MTTVEDFSATSIDGDEVSLATYQGKVLLIVNVASKCGFTPQYDGLEQLNRTYGDQGFAVLGFPSDQFGHQEPGSAEEIKQFCTLTYGVSFPMFARIDVNGRDAHPLYRWLRTQKSGAPGEVIKWNFTKFLVGRDGRVIRRYGPATKPAKLVPDIETALNSKRPLPASIG